MTRASKIEEAARALVDYWEAKSVGVVGMQTHVSALSNALASPAAARCACTHEAGDSPCPIHGMDEPEPVKPTPALPMPKITRYASPEARTGGACEDCGGTGLYECNPDCPKPHKCPACGGTGRQA